MSTFTFLGSNGDTMMIKAGSPCCPNHGEPLEGVPKPLPSKGTGMCPVSGCSFDFECDVENAVAKKDKNGNVTHEYTIGVTGSEK